MACGTLKDTTNIKPSETFGNAWKYLGKLEKISCLSHRSRFVRATREFRAAQGYHMEISQKLLRNEAYSKRHFLLFHDMEINGPLFYSLAISRCSV